MFEGMRRHASWIIIVIASVFILSMAIGGISSIFIKKPFVGMIAGQKIYPDEYREYLKNAYANYAQQNPEKEIDEKTAEEINEQTWTNLVQQILFNKEIKKRHIKITNDDVVEKLKNPSDDVKSIPDFQTDGVFDYEKYEEVLMENPEFAAWMEARIRANLPYETLYEDVKAEVTVTEEEIEEKYIEENDKADVSVIYFDLNSIEEIDNTEEELQQYYEDHKEDYKKDPACKYKYVQIKLEASEADKQIAKTKIDSIYNLLIDGADFAQTAIAFSQGPSAPQGGDLGWFARGRMVKEFEDVAFALKKGETSEPVNTQFGWHIIRVFDNRKNEQGEEEIQASHILFKVDPSEATKQNIDVLAWDLYEKAKENGLETSAEDLSYKITETREFYENATYIGGIGREEEMIRFAFENKVGKLHEPVKTKSGDFIIAELSFKVGIHYQEFSEVEARIKRDVTNEKKLAEVTKKAEEFIQANQPDSYMAAAEKDGWKIIEAPEVILNKTIPGLRNDPVLNKEILKKEKNEYTGLVKGEFGAYIAYIKDHIKPDMEKFETEKDQLLLETQTNSENEHLNTWFTDLKEKAEIIDNRTEFFGN
jgi:parvulin-like peptidyl-prolyl isomerase